MEEKHIPQSTDLINELVFLTSRSSGPGGQNVNKVNSKVTLKFDVNQSVALSEEQKILFLKKLDAKLTKKGVLMIASQDKRSQLQNKEDAMLKLDQFLVKVFTPRKKRKATRPTKSAKLTRLKNKQQHSEKKQLRKKLDS